MSANSFLYRHLGPRPHELDDMAKQAGASSLDELIDKTIPAEIRLQKPLELPEGLTEHEYLNRLRQIARKNRICKTYIGMGYYGTILPPSSSATCWRIRRGILPIRLIRQRSHRAGSKRLLNFQTVVLRAYRHGTGQCLPAR